MASTERTNRFYRELWPHRAVVLRSAREVIVSILPPGTRDLQSSRRGANPNLAICEGYSTRDPARLPGFLPRFWARKNHETRRRTVAHRGSPGAECTLGRLHPVVQPNSRQRVDSRSEPRQLSVSHDVVRVIGASPGPVGSPGSVFAPCPTANALAGRAGRAACDRVLGPDGDAGTR